MFRCLYFYWFSLLDNRDNCSVGEDGVVVGVAVVCGGHGGGGGSIIAEVGVCVCGDAMVVG